MSTRIFNEHVSGLPWQALVDYGQKSDMTNEKYFDKVLSDSQNVNYKPRTMYVIGSLRNEKITEISEQLRGIGIDAFDDWMAAGPEADDFWKKYEVYRGHDYQKALSGYAARHVFSFDKHHLNRCDAALLVLPAGKSGHLELGYSAGLGKQTFILHDGEDGRFDVMYQFANKVFMTKEEMLDYFRS